MCVGARAAAAGTSKGLQRAPYRFVGAALQHFVDNFTAIQHADHLVTGCFVRIHLAKLFFSMCKLVPLAKRRRDVKVLGLDEREHVKSVGEGLVALQVVARAGLKTHFVHLVHEVLLKPFRRVIQLFVRSILPQLVRGELVRRGCQKVLDKFLVFGHHQVLIILVGDKRLHFLHQVHGPGLPHFFQKVLQYRASAGHG